VGVVSLASLYNNFSFGGEAREADDRRREKRGRERKEERSGLRERVRRTPNAARKTEKNKHWIMGGEKECRECE